MRFLCRLCGMRCSGFMPVDAIASKNKFVTSFILAKPEGLPYSRTNMNLKRNSLFLAGFAAVTILFSVTGCSSLLPYEETRSGNYTYINPLAHKPDTVQEHWDYAVSLKERGKISSARKQFEILQKRWPESVLAARAKQMVGDLYYADGKNKKAFQTYEELIAQYYTGVQNYDSVLETQYLIAMEKMEQKRMRWMFGGYSSPQRAVPMFESIIRNAPQWDRAPEIQYLIGQAYQDDDNLEMAIAAYSTAEYRYPDSSIAEKASFAKIVCFKQLVEETPYSVDIREQALLATDLFKDTYPESTHLVEVNAFVLDFVDRGAKHTYDIGEFYERVPRPAKIDSAAIYYRKVVEEYGGTEYAVKAAERLRVLFPEDGLVSPDGTSLNAEILPAAAVVAADGVATAGVASDGRAIVSALPERMTTDDQAVEVTADHMAYKGDLLIGDGHVAFQQQGASLQADHITVNQKTGEITANGNILMMRGNDRWEGQELLYNYKTREGTFGQSYMYFEPAYITSGKSERISTNEYVMTDVMMTTCSGKSPLVYAKAKSVRVLDENKPSGVFLQAKQVTFYVGPVPVFYTPYWHRHLGYRMFTFKLGEGGRMGGYFMGRWETHPTDWLQSNSHLDLYSKRGLGLGQDFDWKTKNGQGSIQTYYINDGDPYDDDDNDLERSAIGANRYRIRLKHRENLAENTYFQTDLSYLSDPDVLDDFFREEYRKSVNPENYAVLQHSEDDYAASLRVDRRMNDFYETVDRLPELTFDWYRSKIKNTPFYFESENNMSFLEKQHSSVELPTFSDYHSGRFDTYNQIFLPLRYQDFFNFIPRAGYRGTWYSDTPGNASYRHVFEAGALASFKAYKTLSTKSGFYGEGLRHTVEPYADYRFRDKPGVRPEDLYDFDEVDRLDKQNEIRFGVRNFLQTKRGNKRIANFLDTDLYTSYRLDRAEGQSEMGPLGAKAQMWLTDEFRIVSAAEYDLHDGSFSNANARLIWTTPEDRNEYAIEYRYLADTRSLISARVELFPLENWSYELYSRYDGTLGEWRQRRFMVNHRFDCVGMGVGYECDEDDEHSIWIQFWLTAFDKAAPDIER